MSKLVDKYLDNGWQFMALCSTFKKIINTNDIYFISFICNHVNNIRVNKTYNLALILSALPDNSTCSSMVKIFIYLFILQLWYLTNKNTLTVICSLYSSWQYIIFFAMTSLYETLEFNLWQHMHCFCRILMSVVSSENARKRTICPLVFN